MARCAATARSSRNWKRHFRGAGWNVIKVIWGSDWDPLLAKDTTACWCKRMGEIVDGEYQKYFVETGAYFRAALLRQRSAAARRWWSTCPTSSCAKLRLGGHDPVKVYAAYQGGGGT